MLIISQLSNLVEKEKLTVMTCSANLKYFELLEEVIGFDKTSNLAYQLGFIQGISA